MSNRIARKGLDTKKIGEYSPSTSEVLLEEICQSFGTELLQAYIDPINGTKLVRESQPVIVEHPNGKKRVLQFQYTRFSPIRSSKLSKIYNENRTREKRKREVSLETVWKEIEAQHEKWDSFKEVTNTQYIRGLSPHRWEKQLYFAVYNIDNEEEAKQKLKPFLIHEGGSFKGKPPQIHITFSIQPYFVIGQYRENTTDIYDILTIGFPQTISEHRLSIHSALSLHPLDKLESKRIQAGWQTPEKVFKNECQNFIDSYKIHSHVQREITMGFIQAYLRKYCLDKTLS